MTWSLQFTWQALAAFVTVLLAIRLLERLWPRRRESGSMGLMLALGAAMWWTSFQFLTAINTELGLKLALAQIGLPAAVLAPVGIYWFALEHTGKGRRTKRIPFRGLVATAVVLALSLAAGWPPGNPWSDAVLVQQGDLVGLVAFRGVGYWVQAGFGLAVTLAAGAILLRDAVAGSRWTKSPVIGAAILLILATEILSLMSPDRPAWRDPAPIGFLIGTMVLTWDVLRNRLLNLGPVARATIVERMRDVVLVLDQKGQIVDLNEAAAVVLGLRSYGSVPVRLGTLWATERAEGVGTHPIDLETSAGEERTFEVTFTPLPSRLGPGRTILVLRDITDRMAMQAQIKAQADELGRANADLTRQANTDALTDLANRRWFMEQLEREVERTARYAGHLSLVLLDLDLFKTVNDTFGHATGDDVLVAAADVLRKVCRESDEPGRLGGEEFAVLLPETDPSGARIFAERVRMGMERTVHTAPDGRSFQITCSVGVATMTQDRPGVRPITGDGLLQLADDAMYRAKDAGRNRVVVAEQAKRAGDGSLQADGPLDEGLTGEGSAA
jgi:diguanylate cyclase (GGDEF)-like protein